MSSSTTSRDVAIELDREPRISAPFVHAQVRVKYFGQPVRNMQRGLDKDQAASVELGIAGRDCAINDTN